eukprot:TRINITY_DN14051_c0_g1_i1.p1 TRINITY_DN14051_c0_g1~~TRINITY_DN14051_c0_g1_i1.p1  ORF type:complete len:1077 (+),score=118.50 TRINITY_DN14051_c0_g1_i1:52-3282(+)
MGRPRCVHVGAVTAAAVAVGVGVLSAKLDKDIVVRGSAGARRERKRRSGGAAAEQHTALAPALARSGLNFSAADFESPPAHARPWTRWWWPGAAVSVEELRGQLADIARNGVGGVELQSMTWGLVTAPSDAEYARTRGYYSDAHRSAVEAVVERAGEIGVQVDLTLGSSWPSGSQTVSAADGLQTLVYSDAPASSSGTTVLPLPRPPLVYWLMKLLGYFMGPGITGWGPDWFSDECTLVKVVCVHVTRDSWTGPLLDWVPFGAARWVVDVLTLEDGREIDGETSVVLPQSALTKQADGTWKVSWTPAAGQWRVVGVWQMPVGEHPIAAAADPAGYVADHLDSDAVVELLESEFAAYKHKFGGAVRGVFIDSFEFKAERHYADGFLERFQADRGYDPSRYLPSMFVPGADHYVFSDGFRFKRKPAYEIPQGIGERLRYDWEITASDAMIEASVVAARKWGDKSNLQVRIQAYGANIDVLRALGEAHVPETEMLLADGIEGFLRMAGSAACLYRRPLASAESMISHKLAYALTPTHVRAGVNKLLASGINHVLYHGTPYKNTSGGGDPRYGYTGWMPFATPDPAWLTMSDDFSSGNTALWGAPMKSVNTYAARLQYAMRQGLPDADVLAYYPWLGAMGVTMGKPEGDEVWGAGYVAGLDDPPSDPFGWWGELGKSILCHTGESEQQKWHRTALQSLRAVERAGAQWVWANTHSLMDATCTQKSGKYGSILIRGAHYRAVTVARNTPYMQPELAEKLEALSSEGCLVWYEDVGPQRQPGFHEWQRGDERVMAAVEKTRQRLVTDTAGFVREMAAADTAFADTAAVPDASKVRALPGPPAVTTWRRMARDGTRYTVVSNHQAESTEYQLQLARADIKASWLDPDTGSVQDAAVSSKGTITRSLKPFGAAVLVVWSPKAAVPEMAPSESSADVSCGAAAALLSVTATAADGKPKQALGDWRSDPALRYASGPVKYLFRVTTPVHPVKQPTKWRLSLGEVCACTAEVKFVNSSRTHVLHNYAFDVDLESVEKRMEFEVVVTPVLRNALKGRARSGEPGHHQHAGLGLVCSGLIGPVRLLGLS